jgi:acyl-CoA synthetase (AMP-forming)/AMP-acid ligase II
MNQVLSGFLPTGDLDDDSWAMACGSEVLSWAQTSDLITRLGNVFLTHAGNGRIAVVGDNSNATVIAHDAALVNGFSSVGVNPKLRSEEFAHIFRDSDSSLAVVSPGASEQAVIAAKSLGIPVLSWPAHADYGDLHWDNEVANASDVWVGSSRPAQAPLLYTSGTSGFPSGTEVQWTDHIGDTVGDLIKMYQDSLGVIPAGPHIVVGPLYHNGPLLAMRMIIAGRPVAIMPKYDAEGALAIIQDRKIASTVLVPTHLVRLMNLEDEIKNTYDVSSMKSIRLTGAACPIPVKEGIMEWFGPIITESYGGTETHSVASISGEEALRKPGSVGRTLARWTVHVVDDEGNEVPAGVSGRLFFIDKLGRGVTFINNPQKTAEANLRPGVCTVGDIGYVDEDGYIYLNDRSVDMVISGGVNIYPAECERILMTHPDIADCAAVGLPDEDMGERMIAVVVVKEGSAAPTTAALDVFCREHLAPYKCPKEYRFLSSTGRNIIGKVNKRALREALLSDDTETHLAAHAGR